MRFGKRRDKETPEGDSAVEAPPAPDPVTEDSLAAGGAADGQAAPSMPPPVSSAAPEPEPVVHTEPEPEPQAEGEPASDAEPEGDAVVEGEAVELPYEPPVAAQPTAEFAPAAHEYVAPSHEYAAAAAYEPPPRHPVEPEPAPRPADSTPRHEPGSTASGGAWPEPAFDLAERPEIIVGAAFGGGLLLALILRRFGN